MVSSGYESPAIPVITVDRAIPEPGKPGVKWWTQSARRLLNQNVELHKEHEAKQAWELELCMGQLRISTPVVDGVDSGSAFNLDGLAASLITSVHNEQDITELVMEWLDEALMSSSDDHASDEDAQSAGPDYDSDVDELEPRRDELSSTTRGATSSAQPQSFCVCPLDVFPPLPISRDAGNATLVATASLNHSFREPVKRHFLAMDIDTSDDEDWHLATDNGMPALKRQRLPMPPARPRRVHKRQNRRKVPFSAVDASGSSSSSGDESYFSDDVHVPRPMSPKVTEIVAQIEDCTLSCA